MPFFTVRRQNLAQVKLIEISPNFLLLELQVGGCHFVYPNATHTRFQHSLGVGHLAYKLAEKLRKENPDKMDEKDSICVMLAGLCHDLGNIFDREHTAFLQF